MRAVLCLLLALAALLPATASAEPQPRALGEQRHASNDLLILRNGDRLSGLLRSESLTLITPFLQPVVLPTSIIAGVDFNHDSSGFQRVTLVNGDTLTGIVQDPELVLLLDGQQETRIRRSLAAGLVFHQRQNEATDAGPHRLILRNGDRLSGTLSTALTVKTSYTTLDTSSLARLDFPPDPTGNVRVHTTEGTEVSAEVHPLEVEFQVLTTGDVIRVYRGDLERVLLDTSSAPLPAYAQRIADGEIINHRLEDATLQHEQGMSGYFYAFEADAGQLIVADQRSSDFDSKLYLAQITPEGGLIPVSSNDDWNDMRDSHLEYHVLSRGVYVLVASRYEGGTVGDFSLELDLRP